MKHGESFHSYVNVYQRVYPINIPLNHYKIPLSPYKIPLIFTRFIRFHQFLSCQEHAWLLLTFVCCAYRSAVSQVRHGTSRSAHTAVPRSVTDGAWKGWWTMGKPWENHGKMVISWENPWEKPGENGDSMGKPMGKAMGKASVKMVMLTENGRWSAWIRWSQW